MTESFAKEARDHNLAVLRTNLSNTRTMLSHSTASIGLIISALGFMKLFDSYLIFDICGWTFIGLAMIVFARGVFLYSNTKRIIDANTGPG